MRRREEGGRECFGCRIKGVSFTFRGARYGRDSFHNETIPGFIRSQVDTSNPNIDKIP